MSVGEHYRNYVLEQLGGLADVAWRRMFGGVGLYAGGAFFAVMDDDQLYFKVDDATRPTYEAAGSKAFAPIPGGKPMTGYYEVPSGVLDDRDELLRWAQRAVAVARARGAMPKRARRAVSAARQVTRGERAGVAPADILRPFPPRVRALANRLRTLVGRAAPSLREAAYPGWKAVGFRHAEAGYICGVFPAAECVRLIFEHGAALDDPDGLLEGRGRVRQVRYVTVRRPADVKVRALTRLVRAAVAHGQS